MRLRDPHLKIQTVPCPDCGQPAGKPCRTATGNITPQGHASRRRIAKRHLEDTP